MTLDRDTLMDALRQVKDPELSRDIVTLNMVKDLRSDGSVVSVTVELTTLASPLKDVIEKGVRSALAGAGASDVKLTFTAQTRGSTTPRTGPLAHVKNIIAVGAGKGGVGKSTIAVAIAIGLARTGARVGLMDGDIHGPSLPTMLGVKGAVPQVRGNKMTPLQVHGIHAITIGVVVEQDKALTWRGPMVTGAFKQLLIDNTEWPDLDYLIIDLPPGTGDIPITLCQILPLTGAVVVATPQQVALDDATRAIKMFQQLGVPVLGIVENMSYFVGPDGTEHDIFGRGGAERAAQNLKLPYLGAIPMFTELRINSDAGKPHANFEGNVTLRAALEGMVKTLAGQISVKNLSTVTPELNIS